MAGSNLRVGLLWRAEWDPAPSDGVDVERCRLHGMFTAFSELGVSAEPVVYSDDSASAVRDRLLELDGVLVWVNPIQKGLDRSGLDPLLREVAHAGVFVSAHPDVILKIATKQVLVDTAHTSWSAPTRLYASHEQLVAELPGRLVAAGPLVLKQHRGMDGASVFKVELREAGTGAEAGVRQRAWTHWELSTGCGSSMRPARPRACTGSSGPASTTTPAQISKYLPRLLSSLQAR